MKHRFRASGTRLYVDSTGLTLLRGQNFETLLKHFGGDEFVFVKMQSPESNTVFEPEFLECVAAFQNEAETTSNVAHVGSMVDRVIMRTRRKMNGDEPKYARSRIQGA